MKSCPACEGSGYVPDGGSTTILAGGRRGAVTKSAKCVNCANGYRPSPSDVSKSSSCATCGNSYGDSQISKSSADAAMKKSAALAELNRLASDLVTATRDFSPNANEKAMSKILTTARGRELYNAYREAADVVGGAVPGT